MLLFQFFLQGLVMKLLGSTTSPFARRLRIYLVDKPFQFINLDIFELIEA